MCLSVLAAGWASTDMRRSIKGQPSPFYLTNTACWLPALSSEQGGRCNDRKDALA